MRPDQLGAELGVSSQLLFALARDGLIPCYAFNNRTYRFSAVAQAAIRRMVETETLPKPLFQTPPKAGFLSAMRDAAARGIRIDGPEFVYFIQAETSPRLVKIGKAVNPKARLIRLRQTSPAKLDLIGVIPGNVELERLFHERFAKERRHGEWFEPSPRLKKFIAEAIRFHKALDRG